MILLTFGIVCFASHVLGCSYPGSPAHSTVIFNTGEVLQTGTVATYKCDPGFDLLGPLRRLCVENGTWIPIGVPVCVLNVALGKAPMQSSVSGKGFPQKAVDGLTSTCTMTEKEKSSWWYVNLLEPFQVKLVRIDFGNTGVKNKQATVVVQIGNHRPDLSANPVCNRFNGIIEEGRPLFFPCTNSVAGAFISIHLESPIPSSLSICETFVYTDQVLPVEQCPFYDELSLGSTATYNGRCYMFHNDEPRSLESARQYCELRGGSLVHETSPALQGFLSWELYKRHRTKSGSDYWNGAVRGPSAGNTWKWIDGKDVTLSFWNLPTSKHNCSKFDGSKGWLWSDSECENKFNFICQHKPVSCGVPERPANSTVLLTRNAPSEVGSMMEYKCNDGHLMTGPTSRTCLETGFYSEFSPKCNFIECGYPANIANGWYNLINGTTFKSGVNYFCQEGFVLVGRKDLTCNAEKKWDGPPPRCDPNICHNPPLVPYSNATLILNSTATGTFAEYSCDIGFLLVGKDTIFCGSHGAWIPEPPTCEVDKALLAHARFDSKQKRNKTSIAERLNMGGIIALGIFGGFVFLAVIISIVVIIVRRNFETDDSVESLNTQGTRGSRERLYFQQEQMMAESSDISKTKKQHHQQTPLERVNEACHVHHSKHPHPSKKQHASRTGDATATTHHCNHNKDAPTTSKNYCPKHPDF